MTNFRSTCDHYTLHCRNYIPNVPRSIPDQPPPPEHTTTSLNLGPNYAVGVTPHIFPDRSAIFFPERFTRIILSFQ